MARALTSTKARKALAALDNAPIAPVISQEVDYAALGSQISQVEQKRLDVELSNVQALQVLALSAPKMSPEVFDAKVRVTLTASLLALYRARGANIGETPEAFEKRIAENAKSRGGLLKTAFLALSHGYEPTPRDSVSSIGRLAVAWLDEKGIKPKGNGRKASADGSKASPAAKKGRPVGSTAEEPLPILSDREEACRILARTGDDVSEGQIAARVKLLMVATRPAHWAMLAEAIGELFPKALKASK